MRAGFPHSDIVGSKLYCQLPHAFRRLTRPSSPVIAKASTTCTYSLDPITLSSLPRTASYRQLVCAPTESTVGSMQSQPYRWLLACRLPAIQPSSILLKSTNPVRGQAWKLHKLPGLTSHKCGWWRMTGSNRRPPACKAGALPAELIPRHTGKTTPRNKPPRRSVPSCHLAAFGRYAGGSGWNRTNDPRLIKTML